MTKQQSSSNLSDNMQQLEDHLNNEKSIRFPKKIGIVFLGERIRLQNKRSKLYLDFDDVACAHILLQMNHIQNLFEYQIVAPLIKDVSIVTKDNGNTVQWFDKRTNSTQSFLTNGDAYMLEWFEHLSSKLENDFGYPAATWIIGLV